MRFSELRHRIFLLKPQGTTISDMYEQVPAYEVYRPGLRLLVVTEETEGGVVYYRPSGLGNATPVYDKDRRVSAHLLLPEEYAFHAFVRPTTGREYEESQKLRAETTYMVKMRYVPGITHDMQILYGTKKLKIESVLDVGERHTELTIVCAEVCK